jgi:hypothetical protein
MIHVFHHLYENNLFGFSKYLTLEFTTLTRYFFFFELKFEEENGCSSECLRFT